MQTMANEERRRSRSRSRERDGDYSGGMHSAGMSGLSPLSGGSNTSGAVSMTNSEINPIGRFSIGIPSSEYYYLLLEFGSTYLIFSPGPPQRLDECPASCTGKN